MSMISPEAFIDSIKDYTYEKLIKERDKLTKEIRRYEKGNIDEIEIQMNPSADTIYSMNLQYLSKLLEFMHNKFIDRGYRFPFAPKYKVQTYARERFDADNVWLMGKWLGFKVYTTIKDYKCDIMPQPMYIIVDADIIRSSDINETEMIYRHFSRQIIY